MYRSAKILAPHKKIFFEAFSWNALESIYYQIVYSLLMIGLYKIMGSSSFGLLGTLFSLIYLAVSFSNLGLDASLPPLFNDFSKNKKSAATFIKKYILSHYLYLSVILFLIGWFLCYTHQQFLNNSFSITSILLSLLLIFFESSKKTFKTLLRLANFNKKIASIEAVTITLYSLGIYCAYYQSNLTIENIFINYLILSALSGFLYLYLIYSWINNLPKTENNVLDLNIDTRFKKSRIFVFFNQTCSDLFSGNVLIPFIALHSGIEYAGIFKLLSTASQNITTLLRNAFGNSTSILFSSIKNESKNQKEKKLKWILSFFNYSLVIFLGLGIIYAYYICGLQKEHSIELLLAALLFILLTISQNALLIYEKFLIVEEKLFHLFILYSFTLINTSFLMVCTPKKSITLFLFLLCLLRLITFLITKKLYNPKFSGAAKEKRKQNRFNFKSLYINQCKGSQNKKAKPRVQH